MDTLITTKLTPPPQRPGQVRRDRLNALLAASDRPLVVVCAPAGYGKTTVVGHWLAQSGRPAAWLSLDDADDAPATFMAYLLAALQRAYPGFGPGLHDTLAVGGPVQPDRWASALINDLAAAARPVRLVLDDWQVITDPAIVRVIHRLIQHPPADFQLILISREEPDLPLARLRARDALREVRAADLRFTPEEATRFLHETMGLTVGASDVAALETRTEGWITGLHLAALSIRGSADPQARIAAFTKRHPTVLKYLLDEVLERQPVDLQTFLLEAASLDTVTPALCDAALSRTDSAEVLARLMAADLFITPLDVEHSVFRFHPLFADLLRAQQARRDPARAAAIARRAAHWLEAHGWVPQAVAQAMAGDDPEAAADLIERQAGAAIGRGDHRLVGHWLTALPDGVLRRRPRLCLDQAWVRVHAGQASQAEEWLDATEAALTHAPESRRDALEGECLTLRAYLAAGDPRKALALVKRATARVSADDHHLNGLIHAAMATHYRTLGDYGEALARYISAVPALWASGNIITALLIAGDVVLISRITGELDRAETLCRQLLSRAEAAGLSQASAVGVVYLALSEIALERGDLETATRWHAAALARDSLGELAAGEFGLFLTARLRILGGDADALDPVGAELESRLQEQPEPNVLAVVWIAYLLIEHRQFARAERWLARLRRHLDAGATPATLEARSLVYHHQALSQLGAPTPAACKDLMAVGAALASEAAGLGWQGLRAEILALRALLALSIEDRSSAMADLGAACDAAQRDQRILVFVSKGEAMAAALRAALHEGVAQAAFIRAILAAFPRVSAPDRDRRGLLEPLTQRETSILQLLIDGLTYAEIGRRLVISVNTVRYHIKSLYGKLGVGSRRQAISRAHEWGYAASSR